MSNDAPSTQPGVSHSGCLFRLGIAGLILGFLVLGLLQARTVVRTESERIQQERREKMLVEVRSGGAYVTIVDAKLMEMLVDDPICRENVTSICFFMADLGDRRFRRICEFPNVADIGFYDCRSADNVMAAAKGMPGIESLSFEVTGLSDASMRSMDEFPSLKSLCLGQVLPDAKIEALCELLPNVEIEAHSASEEAEYRAKFNRQETKESE